MHSWQYWTVVATWLVWEFYWGYSARNVKQAASKEPLWSRLPVLAGLLLAFSCLLIPEVINKALLTPFLPQGGLFFYLGYAVQLSGLALAFRARAVLGRNWSGRVTIKEDHELVTQGPYALVRHPIYTGAVLAIAGSALALGHVGGLVAILLMAGVFVRKILLEEKVLTAHFGEKYAEYKKQTSALIPFLF